jgi:hypothetical protein
MIKNAASTRSNALKALKYVLKNGSINAADSIYVEKAIKELQGAMPEKFICKQCGKQFERFRSQLIANQLDDHVFCTCACFHKYRARNGQTMHDYVCDYCGKSFSLPYKKLGKHVFCKPKCFYDFKRNKGPRT